MIKPPHFAQDDFTGTGSDDDEIVYEPLDDVTWVDEDEIEVIELPEEPAVDVTEVPPEIPAGDAVEETGEAPAETPAASAPAAVPLPLPLELPPEAGPEQAAEPVPAPGGPPCLYRVVIPLDEALRSTIDAVRGEHALGGPAPAALELIAPFRSDHPDALADALRTWSGAWLPLELALDAVSAEVIGPRRYVAGWSLEPAGRLIAAQHALVDALDGLREPCEGESEPFEPRIVVADRVPPHVFPHLIADMQRAFEPQRRAITAIVLEEATPGPQPPRWSVRLSVP